MRHTICGFCLFRGIAVRVEKNSATTWLALRDATRFPLNQVLTSRSFSLSYTRSLQMPAFQAPAKRKSDVHDSNPALHKRVALNNDVDANTTTTRGTGGSNASKGEQYWMVQWCGYLTSSLSMHLN